ncbi:hypothetical protein [Clostridium sp.]|uniref:hypothetical protein n=1 Tax=Clostridium sp. TaxID=1506 RepID=UPI0025B9D652|nr:hypothetical protein [Clostridium sp.]
MDMCKIINKITHEELAERFIKINTGVKVIDWQPLIIDECQKYSKATQPIIRVDIEGGNWLRVYINKESNEINWY